MNVTAEEELEIMADPVETKEELRVKAGTIDASNSKTVNKLQRVVVHATDGSPEPSPFLAGTLDATQDSKKNPSLQGDDEQIYLESLYRSMLKQQEWLSVEIKRIQKSLFEKKEKLSPGGPSKSQKRDVRAAFKDDTAQAACERGFLSRHSSEPEAESVDPPIIKRIGSQESSERKESKPSDKKRHLRDFDDDQMSLCMPTNQPSPDEEVRTNDSVELNKVPGDAWRGGVIRSNRSSGKSSFGNVSLGKCPNMSGSCPDLYLQGLSQSAQLPYCPNSDGCGMECMMPRSKMPVTQQNYAPMGGYIHQQHSMPIQMPMPNGPGMFPQYGHSIHYNRMMMMMPQMMGQRYPMFEQYPQYRNPSYHQQQQVQTFPVAARSRIPGPVSYNPNAGIRMEQHPTKSTQLQGNGKPTFQQSNGLERPLKRIAREENIRPAIVPACIDSKADHASEKVETVDLDANQENDTKEKTSEPNLSEIQDFNLSPEEFDAIFEEFDLQNAA